MASARKKFDGSLPLAGLIRLYDAQLRSERKSPKTIEAYNRALRRFSGWFEAEEGREPRLSDYNRTSVRLFLADLVGRPKWEGHPTLAGRTDGTLSTSTLHQTVRSLKTFGAWLAVEGYVEDHPLASLRLPRLDEKAIVPLSEEEERRLLAAYSDSDARECRIKAMFMLMLDTGLRRGEVISLKRQDVNLDQGHLLVMGKGRKERVLPFGFTCERVLRRYLACRVEPATAAIDEFFLSEDGYPLTANAVELIFVRARKRTGIERLHPHLLRHTYGIRAQEQGMPTLTLQHFMGHTSPKITERYAHAAQSERLKRARGFSPVDQLRMRVGRASR
jgi:site-specific recombinase XerD